MSYILLQLNGTLYNALEDTVTPTRNIFVFNIVPNPNYNIYSPTVKHN